jgi:hypothetical protein
MHALETLTSAPRLKVNCSLNECYDRLHAIQMPARGIAFWPYLDVEVYQQSPGVLEFRVDKQYLRGVFACVKGTITADTEESSIAEFAGGVSYRTSLQFGLVLIIVLLFFVFSGQIELLLILLVTYPITLFLTNAFAAPDLIRIVEAALYTPPLRRMR